MKKDKNLTQPNKNSDIHSIFNWTINYSENYLKRFILSAGYTIAYLPGVCPICA